MAFQLKNQNDIKIFILYLLMNVPRPLSYNELNDIVVQDELVSSLDFAECIAQLEDTGNVASTLVAVHRLALAPGRILPHRLSMS